MKSAGDRAEAGIWWGRSFSESGWSGFDAKNLSIRTERKKTPNSNGSTILIAMASNLEALASNFSSETGLCAAR